jgi:ATP-dependent DNA helicase DinG
MKTRFSPEAAEKLRGAIKEAGGIEVFAIGRMGLDQYVTDIDVHCRGNQNSVPALLRTPRPGEVVIHNHPSGVLEASGPDMQLAQLYGDDGIGVVIVDNDVRRALWVVEPMVRKVQNLDPQEVRAFFEDRLPSVIAGYEKRDGQLAMALDVTHAFNEGSISLLEAGTGTGKSLAYLVPAALWAMKNEARVAVSTFTIALQGQLVTADLPLLKRAGLDVRFAAMMGRHNYLCKRKLDAAQMEASDAEASRGLKDIADWARTTPDGTRADMAFQIEETDWDQVNSDPDQTLRVRCPHYDSCHYYEARRACADAHVIVVNHHLLMADLHTKYDTGGVGVLPRYDRIVLDEGHHLEDAATMLFEDRVGIEGIRRAIRPLLPGLRKRPGTLSRIHSKYLCGAGPLDEDETESATTHLQKVDEAAAALYSNVPAWFENIADASHLDQLDTVRTPGEYRAGPVWNDGIVPTLRTVSSAIHRTLKPLDSLIDTLDGLPLDVRTRDAQLLFELSRARRRLGDKAKSINHFHGAEVPDGSDALTGEKQWVSWIARDRGHRSAPAARLCMAPIDVGPLLRERVFEAMPASVVTSATLTVAKQFDHLRGRIGLESCTRLQTARYPSPFNYRTQALLGIPRDLPTPKEPGFEQRAGEVILDAIRASDGGTFVLCTSYALIDSLHARAEAEFGDDFPLLKQGQMSRGRLIERFKEDRRSVLFGTNSFWEGIDVKGDQLRLVIIPRLPFRVPTEPVQQARYERLEAQGLDPFRAYALPQAVLRFRQGFGRLIRTQKDRGVVLVLDRRVTNQWYGRVFLASLPDVLRAQGPAKAVLMRIRGSIAGEVH